MADMQARGSVAFGSVAFMELPRRPARGPDAAGALGAEQRLEGARERGVAVADQ